MRIVIDLQGAQSASSQRGIGRYSIALAEAIARNKGQHDVYCSTKRRLPSFYRQNPSDVPIIAAEREYKGLDSTPARLQHRPSQRAETGAREIIYAAFLNDLQPDIIHISSLFEGYADDCVTAVKAADFDALVSVTLYDFIPLHNPESLIQSGAAWMEHYQRKLRSLKKADILLAISQFVADEAAERLETSSRIVNIGGACSSIFRKQNFNTAEREVF